MTKKRNGNIRITRGVTLVPLDSGRWRVRVNVPGKGAAGRQSKDYADRGGAVAAGQAWKTKLEKEGTAAAVQLIRDHRSARFSEFASRWVTDYEPSGIKPTTRKAHRLNLKHILPTFGARWIGTIEPGQVRKWVEDTRQQYSDGYVRGMLGTLSLIFDAAIEEKHIPFNPTDTISIKQRVQTVDELEEEAVVPLSVEQQQRIIAVADRLYGDAHFGTMLRIAFQTGCRRGELLALKAEDVDLDRATATISKTWSRSTLSTPKTGKKRVVQLGCPISVKSKEWRPQQAIARDVVKRIRAIGRVSGYLFGVTADKPCNANTYDLRWAQCLEAAKVAHQGPKVTRHTTASVLLSRGAEPIFVRRQGGWASDQMLTKHYAKWLDEGEKIRLGKASVQLRCN